MITIMKANEMMPSWAMENATPVDLAIMKVAAAVPGPQMTSAAVPMNSAASFLERVTSAIDPPTTPGNRGAVDRTSFGREWGNMGRDDVRLYRTMFRQSFRPPDAAVNRDLSEAGRRRAGTHCSMGARKAMSVDGHGLCAGWAIPGSRQWPLSC